MLYSVALQKVVPAATNTLYHSRRRDGATPHYFARAQFLPCAYAHFLTGRATEDISQILARRRFHLIVRRLPASAARRYLREFRDIFTLILRSVWLSFIRDYGACSKARRCDYLLRSCYVENWYDKLMK